MTQEKALVLDFVTYRLDRIAGTFVTIWIRHGKEKAGAFLAEKIRTDEDKKAISPHIKRHFADRGVILR